ncbi:hypothetical protein A3K80_02310 [Candidatus Bathyarchaeota archaeon RBG_13_38_9]|nr:MAG: hypothetical protein A3K80_02310 [Candidatus Bathyarchaeota archaeon RBG_13_38_9]
MMEKMMEKFFEDMTIKEKQKLIEKMMPKMMENCLSSMSREERTRMFTFCNTMLKEMEDEFLK